MKNRRHFGSSFSMIARKWYDDPAPGTTCGDEVYLGNGIWETIPAGSERD